jgi:hypothetical protein
MSKENQKPDIDNVDFDNLFSQDEVTNSALREGVAALSGKSSASKVIPPVPASPPKIPSPKAAPNEPKKNASKPNDPGEKTDESDGNDSEPDEDTIRLTQMNSRISSLYSQLKLQKKHNEQISEFMKIQDGQIADLEAIVKSQDSRIKVLEEEVSFYKEDYKTELKSLEEKMMNKHNETVRVMHETPDIVEKLVQSTNQIIGFLPEETKKTLKKVELTPQEKAVMTSLRVQTAIPRRKLPKHAR